MLRKLCSTCICNSFRLHFLNYGVKNDFKIRRTFISKNEVNFNLPDTMTLSKHVKSLIKFKGPLTVSEYMKEALTNPLMGYYMTKDVFGKKGDFVTSPEMNQLFGELIAIWIINEWKKIGGQKPLHLVELGPGRGTMMDDILRVFKKFNLTEGVSCHLVEVSPELSKLQVDKLGVKLDKSDEDLTSQHYQKGICKYDIPVFWYNCIKSVPPEFTTIIAHEFFDALPIHKFKKTDKGWREILIDIDPSNKDKSRFRYVLAPGPSATSNLLVNKTETKNEVEVSPQSAIIMNEIAIRLEQFGGFALIADYGHDGTLTDTFRAYKDHKQCDPLIDPGTADLTADVDFNYLKQNTLDKLIHFGPVTQREFLLRMHIDVRLRNLLQNCKNEEERASVTSAYKVMIDPSQMGNRFKFMSFFPVVLKDYLEKVQVAGFSD